MKKTIEPASRLRGSIIIPPDKSVAHRAAMLASISEAESSISNYPTAADPQSTLACMEQLGVPVKKSDDEVVIQGVGRNGLKAPDKPLDCGNSGTTMRLLTGLLAGAGIPATLQGDESLSRRTMKRIIEPLRKMGLTISAKDDAFPPLRIDKSMPVRPIRFELPVASAQVKSCVLLAGLFGDGSTEVVERIPSRNHTEKMLGLDVIQRGDKRLIFSSNANVIPQQSMRIPGDFSSAAFWLVAGAIHSDADLKLIGVGINSSRTALLDILLRMGAQIEISNERQEGKEPVADFRVRTSNLQATEIQAFEVPNAIDELPIIAVAMALAKGKSSIRNASELRHKETDRISAISDILNAAGVTFQEFEDGLEITGNSGGKFKSFTGSSRHDHRVAMAAAVMGLCSTGPCSIDQADAAAVSYPDFWTDMESIS